MFHIAHGFGRGLCMQSFLSRGLCYKVGDGRSLNCWADPWLPLMETFRPKPRILGVEQLQQPKVSDLVSSQGGEWNVITLRHLFDDGSVAAILRIPPPITGCSVKRQWMLSIKRELSVRDAYELIIKEHPPPCLFRIGEDFGN
ncbi:hypothetical protein CJ030_MR1G005387 [Morella rubra]|uniref:Uncharacterized protein n=1 Tax=Morella rubra TaxID=262757 RepID=A0A6A1WML3_9ROSI|nr:hypothetical protein CJ030_MR1G005394 [Morella rubra]KAB1225084.1 hypothetical protein CJ030_MR1G005387 [Morella rubra]